MDPPALRNKPNPPSYLDYYIKAFWTLCSTRQAGNCIQFHDLVSYLQLYPWYDKDEFITLILIMDSAYMEQKHVRQRDNTKRKD